MADTRKTVVLTGGPGSTIGSALMERLAGESYNVVATWSSSGPTDGKNAENGSVQQLDVTDTTQAEAFVSRVIEQFGSIDVLINNAGISMGGTLAQTSYDEWKRVVDVNLTGVFAMCKAVAPVMTRNMSGQIINISSITGLVGAPGASAYAASKGGVIAFTRSIARELAESGTMVNAVCPGFVSSRLNRFDPLLRSREARRALLNIDNNLSDLVNFVSFLCAGHFRSVTGQVFHIDSRIH